MDLISFIYCAVACFFSISLFHSGFDNNGKIMYRSLKAGYIFAILCGILWPLIILYILICTIIDDSDDGK